MLPASTRIQCLRKWLCQWLAWFARLSKTLECSAASRYKRRSVAFRSGLGWRPNPNDSIRRDYKSGRIFSFFHSVFGNFRKVLLRMPVVAAVFALAAATWGAICARRGSLLVAVGLLLAVGYALGHEFWNARLGPFPVTL